MTREQAMRFCGECRDGSVMLQVADDNWAVSIPVVANIRDLWFIVDEYNVNYREVADNLSSLPEVSYPPDARSRGGQLSTIQL